MPRPILVWAFLTMLVLGLVLEIAEAGEKWGPFRGRIVDVETGQGIEGAVALAIWEKVFPTVAGTMSEFYDVREVVSGPDGRFEIPRREPPFFTLNIREPDFKVFAPSYAEVRWVVTPESGEALIDPTVIEMRKLRTREERLRNLPSIPTIFFKADLPRGGIRRVAPRESLENYLRAINREEEALNLKPTQY